MKRSDIKSPPGYFDRYIDLVDDIDIISAMQASKKDLENLDMNLYHKIGDKVYQPGKWTIKDIFQHITDNERIMSYRALRFARKDKTILPSVDENMHANAALANRRSLEDIIEELIQIRLSCIQLYKSFDPSVMHETGVAFNCELSPLALGFIIVGHQIHHMNVIQERYAGLAL